MQSIGAVYADHGPFRSGICGHLLLETVYERAYGTHERGIYALGKIGFFVSRKAGDRKRYVVGAIQFFDIVDYLAEHCSYSCN